MHALNLIARHLPQSAPFPVEDVSAQCAFTGQLITKGIPLDLLIKENFTDLSYLRYKSEYASLDAALCISSVIPTGRTRGKTTAESYVSLRNYSYYADAEELRILRREEVLPLVLDIPRLPFVLAVTYSNKKHTAYKTQVNTDRQRFVVTTDIADVHIDMSVVTELLSVMQRWYTILPGKEEAKLQPTYFNKAQIESGQALYAQIKNYGADLFERENEYLAKYRGTHLFQFLLFILNKSTYA